MNVIQLIALLSRSMVYLTVVKTIACCAKDFLGLKWVEKPFTPKRQEQNELRNVIKRLKYYHRCPAIYTSYQVYTQKLAFSHLVSKYLDLLN